MLSTQPLRFVVSRVVTDDAFHTTDFLPGYEISKFTGDKGVELCKMSDMNMMYLNMYLNKMKPVPKGGVLDLCVLAGAYLAATR